MAAETATAATAPGQFTYTAATAQSYFPLPFHLQYPDLATQQYAAISTPAISTTATLANTTAAAYVYPTVAPVVSTSTYSLPLYQQAQQLLQRDMQMITPQALQNVKAAIASSDKVELKKKAVPRKAAGQTWEDPTLADWPEDDYRLFCGDLGNEVNDDVLTKAFSRFPSFNMARVVRDKRTGKTKGYGFVSFANVSDLYAALKEMNGKYVGNRPIKLRRSTWKERIDYEALQKQKSQPPQKPKLPKKGVLHK